MSWRAEKDAFGLGDPDLKIVRLGDAGYTPTEIAEQLGLEVGYVTSVVKRCSMYDQARHISFFNMARRGTMLLGRAVNAAGGHR